MTAEQFWHNGMDMYYAYYKAFMLKREDKTNDNDILAWFIGDYVAMALSATPIMPLGLLGAKDIKKARQQYPQQPRCLDKEKSKANIKPIKKKNLLLLMKFNLRNTTKGLKKIKNNKKEIARAYG